MKDFQVSKFANFFLIGIDHTTAPVDIREKFTLDEKSTSHLINDYKELGGDGIMVLTTCNRTEVYAFGNCPRDIISLFCKHTETSQDLFYRYQQIKQNIEAIEHIFRVGAGLESKILGDFEIIGQIKKAYQFAKGQNAHNAFLDRLVNSAAQCSKQVKNETGLSTGSASVAFAAVMQVKKYMLKNPNPKVLLYGMGKMGRTACENLINQTGLKDITLINRTEEKAVQLAEKFGLKHMDVEHLSDALNASDVIIVATGAHKPTVLLNDLSTSKNHLVLDLSMPRNVEKAIYENPSFEVIDVDHLSEVAQESITRRQAEIPKALEIIELKVQEFYQWLESRKVAPTLQALREKLDQWKTKELANASKKFPSLNSNEAEAFASQMLNRITGQFARQLKSGSDVNGDLRTIHHIFELENS